MARLQDKRLLGTSGIVTMTHLQLPLSTVHAPKQLKYQSDESFNIVTMWQIQWQEFKNDIRKKANVECLSPYNFPHFDE